MALTVPPPLQFKFPKQIQPLRTADEIAEATGRPVLWRTSDFRLTYTRWELRNFAKLLAAGAAAGEALKQAVTEKRYRQIGGKLNKAIEAQRLADLPEVKRAVREYQAKNAKRQLMDMIERRGHMARLARRPSTPPASVINACIADARFAGELDPETKVDVSFQQVLQSVQLINAQAGACGLLPTDAERARIEAKLAGGRQEAFSDVGIERGGEIVEAEEGTPVPQAHPLDGARTVAEIEMGDDEEEAENAPAIFGEISDGDSDDLPAD